jgi:hypothetical protein
MADLENGTDIATDPDLNYEGRPAFLIDATTRPGMSGSPVVVRMWGGIIKTNGNYRASCGPVTRFLGVYSGTVYDTSEIGRVWRPQVIDEILNSIK